MVEDFKSYLNSIKFDKYLNQLNKKLKGKSAIIYGTGSLFQFIKDNYDLSKLNIIGISDKKYALEQEGSEDLGYKIIPKDKMVEYGADYVIVAAQNYIGIIENFELEIFKGTKTKIKPLAKMPFLELLKQIWSR